MDKSNNLSFLQKASNIWYHYKWAILILIGFIIIFSVAFAQSSSKVSPDATVLYASTQALTINEYDAINRDIKEIVSQDYNGDGNIDIDIIQVSFNMFDSETHEEKEFYNPAEQTTMKQRFDIELSSGTSVIYIMEKALYNGIKDYVSPLTDVLGYLPEHAYDDKSIELSNLAAFYNTALKVIPSDNVICIRPMRTKGVLGGNDSEEYYENCVSVFRDIIEFGQ